MSLDFATVEALDVAVASTVQITAIDNSSGSPVVVGMGMNPMPKKARAALDAAGVPYKYLEYGNYFNTWRRRNALKMWTGWPTFPMVFVQGTLVGGAADLEALIASGELKKLLA